MEGFGNYNPDADPKRASGVVEKSVAVLANLGEYVPDTWKSKLGLYDAPSRASNYSAPDGIRPRQPMPAFATGSTYSSGSFNFNQMGCRTPPVGFRGETFMSTFTNYPIAAETLPRNGAFTQIGSGDRGAEQHKTSPKIISPAPIGEYEARLVKRIVQPRGGRTQPIASELATFKMDITGLELSPILISLKEFICDPDLTWQWKIRALCVLQSLTSADAKVKSWVQQNEELQQSMKRINQKQCESLVRAILAQCGRDSEGRNEEGSSQYVQSTAASPQLIDLLDEADVLMEQPAKSASPSADQKPSLLDDLF